MKLLVETTGQFMLHMPSPEQTAHHDRPSVVRESQFINLSTADGKLKVLAQLNDEATDAEFLKTLEGSNGDADLAVAAFSSMFPLEGPAKTKNTTKPAPAPAPKPKPEAK